MSKNGTGEAQKRDEQLKILLQVIMDNLSSVCP